MRSKMYLVFLTDGYRCTACLYKLTLILPCASGSFCSSLAQSSPWDQQVLGSIPHPSRLHVHQRTVRNVTLIQNKLYLYIYLCDRPVYNKNNIVGNLYIYHNRSKSY